MKVPIMCILFFILGVVVGLVIQNKKNYDYESDKNLHEIKWRKGQYEIVGTPMDVYINGKLSKKSKSFNYVYRNWQSGEMGIPFNDLNFHK